MSLRGYKTAALGATVSGFVLAFAPSAGAATSHSAIATDPLEKIRIWEGHWTMQVQTRETPYSHAASKISDAQCSWLAHKNWMVCDYLSGKIDPARGKPDNNLSVFTYSDIDKAYRHLGFGAEGPALQEVISVEGNVWTTPFEYTTDKGQKLWCRNVYEFVSPEKQLYRLEVSTDDQHWTVVDEGVATKTA